jgi:hypothetical protein
MPDGVCIDEMRFSRASCPRVDSDVIRLRGQRIVEVRDYLLEGESFSALRPCTPHVCILAWAHGSCDLAVHVSRLINPID